MSLFGIGQGFSLKELLENPKLQNPPNLNRDTLKEKEKSYEPDYTSAFLGPNLWGNNNAYEDESLKLEYMDLDEFLSENGIPLNLEENSNSNEEVLPNSAPVPPREVISASSSPCHIALNPSEVIREPRRERLELKEEDEEEDKETEDDETTNEYTDDITVVGKQEVTTADIPDIKLVNAPSGVNVERLPSLGSRVLKVEFDVNEADLALATIPGQDGFNPKERRFTDEELKPQPIIKKSRKIFVPEDLKDDRYWSRRKKNNIAAKRSRDARRAKENQIAMRAAFLEKENETFKAELMKIKAENASLKLALSKYEGGSS